MFPLLQKISSRQICPTKNAKLELSRCVRYSSSSTCCMLENFPSKYIVDYFPITKYSWQPRIKWSSMVFPDWENCLQRCSQFPIVSEKKTCFHDFPCLISTRLCHSSRPSRRKAKISHGSKQGHLLKLEDSRFQQKSSAKKEKCHRQVIPNYPWNPPSLQLSASCPQAFGTNDRASSCWVPRFLGKPQSIPSLVRDQRPFQTPGGGQGRDHLEAKSLWRNSKIGIEPLEKSGDVTGLTKESEKLINWSKRDDDLSRETFTNQWNRESVKKQEYTCEYNQLKLLSLGKQDEAHQSNAHT